MIYSTIREQGKGRLINLEYEPYWLNQIDRIFTFPFPLQLVKAWRRQMANHCQSISCSKFIKALYNFTCYLLPPCFYCRLMIITRLFQLICFEGNIHSISPLSD